MCFSGSQVESLKHSHKLEVASVKLECARSKGELERERDTLQGQIDGMKHTHSLFPLSLNLLGFAFSSWMDVMLSVLLLVMERSR